MNILKITTFVALAFALVACETADDVALEQARSCINSAMKISLSDPTNASIKATECETKVVNLTSAESGRIGFSAILIKEGKISQIANSAGALSAATNSVGISLSYMAFPNTGPGLADMDSMVIYATRSASPGILKISTIIQTATILNKLGVLTAGSEASVQTALATLIGSGSAADKDAAAGALILLQQSSCSGADASSPICTKVTQAVGTDPTTAVVLTALQTFLAGSG